MHKKMAKAVAGGLVAASMLASSAAAMIPMGAFAKDYCVGQTDFDAGVGLPWHTCVTNPANQTFDMDGGTYNCKIVNPGGEKRGGDSRWDCQFRHRSLHIERGHSYKIHWEVNATNAGELHTHIATLDGSSVIAWQNNATDYNQGWSNVSISKGKNSFDSSFTATETIEVAEWAFHYGGAGPYQDQDCFPEGTVLSFDNCTLECTTCGSTYKDEKSTPCLWDPTNELGKITPRTDVRANQVGYLPNMVKKATYCTDKAVGKSLKFEVRDAKSDKAVYTGETVDAGYDDDAGEYCQIIDFTKLTDDGEYYIWVDDTSNTFTNEKTGDTYDMYKSHTFKLGNDVYDGILTDALNYYYQNRSGMAIETDYITSYNPRDDKKKLAHAGGHAPNDNAYVQSKWVKAYGQEFDGDKQYTVDGVGGWYDAGDHGKYVVNGGISVWTLQNMYEYAKATGTDAKFADGKEVKIPQKYSVGNISFDGTGSPDILDEARVELEWMFNMMVSSKDPYWGSKYENFVYHKLHDHKWTGLATTPVEYAEEWGTTRIVKPPTYAATFNMIACAAQASRLWAGIDDAFSKKCLDNAKKSWDAVMKYKSSWQIEEGTWEKDPMFAPLDQAIGGGGYGDSYVQDDAYWAACELFSTTGDDTYYNFLKEYNNKNDKSGDDKAFSVTTSLGGGENHGSFSSFNWGCTAGLGTLSLYLSKNTSAADKAKIEASITKAADTYIDFMDNESGVGIPYYGTTFTDDINAPGEVITGYEWGSNSFVLNNAMVMAYAYDINGTNKYISGASEAMDYIFGRNGNGFSYVTGYGTYHEQNPHHRYWSYELDHEFPLAPSGVVSGGPGAGLQDPYVGGLGYKRGTVASQKCFVDSIEAWSVNEVTINWNAPFAWVISFLDDEAANAPTPDGQGTTKPPVSDPTTGDVVWGDANCDGVVSMADAVLILQSLASPDKYGVNGSEAGHITAQGVKNGDVYENGSNLTASDASSIQKFCIKLISKLPES